MSSVAVLPASALLVGVWVGIGTTRPLPYGGAALVVLLVFASVARAARRDWVAFTLLISGYATAGAVLGAYTAGLALEPSLRTVLEREFGGFALADAGPPSRRAPLLVRARLEEDGVPGASGVSVRAAIESVAIGGRTHRIAGGVRLNIGGEAASARAAVWRAGRTIEAPVSFRRPARYQNDGVPDFERELALDGISLNAGVKSALLVDVVSTGSAFEEAAADARAAVRLRIARWVGARDPLAAAIVTAILIGDRTGLPAAMRTRLQAAGTYHVIAISGGNIAILAVLLTGVFVVLGITGRMSATVAIAGLLAYGSLVSAGPSVWRATTMAVTYLAARLLDHRSPPWNAMAVSASVLACAAPLDVRDAGFALTFGATAAILEAARRVGPIRPRSRPLGRVLSWLLAGVAASLAAEIVLLPISAAVFSRVTFAGLVLNLAAVPLMTVAQVAGLVVVAGAGFAWVAAPAGWTAASAARLLVDSAALVDIVPWLALRVPPPSTTVVVVYYTALGAAVWWPGSRRRAIGTPRATVAPRVGAVVAAGCAVLILTGAAPRVRPAPLDGRMRLTVFDVGQGDAALLQTPSGRAVLVDSGGVGADGAAFDIGSRVIAPALWARGVRRLDALALTHGDPDHAGGAPAVLRDFRPRAVWEGIPVPGHPGLRSLREQASDAGVPIEYLFATAHRELDGVSIRVLHPTTPDWERQKVRNDDSLVLEIRHSDVAILMTGDIGASVEQTLLPSLEPAAVRILKVAHHGSRTSTSQALLDAWKPHIAIISCGRGNPFGHPATEVIERLESSGARIYRTDREGQVTVESDGRTTKVMTHSPRGRRREEITTKRTKDTTDTKKE